MASKHTTSIVDISEIEDDEAPLASATTNNINSNNNSNTTASNNNNNYGGQPGGVGQQPAPSGHLYLYHEDLNQQQRIPSLLSSLTVPAAGKMAPHQQQQQRSRDSSPGQTLQPGGHLAAIEYHPTEQQQQQQQQRLESALGSAAESAPNEFRTGTPAPAGDAKPSANLGTLSGVYFPCVQNIFGVILFIRMVWIVGTAGVPAAFALVFICCCVTLTTSISLSAIATNGIVPAGGSYFMISRSLGPECGGAVGTMFFLGTTFAGAMYITGAVEIMLNYLAPSWGLFGDFQRDVSIMYHNIRVYGTLLLIIVGLMVWIGVRFVSKLAPIALFCVLFSIFSIYAGIFINYNGRPDLMICVLGDRLVTLKNLPYDEPGTGTSNYPLSLQDSSELSATDQARLFANGSSHLSASLYQMRRTKALCTYEKLRYIYCPNELAQQQQQRQQQQQQTDFSTGEMADLTADMAALQQQQQQQRLQLQLQQQQQASLLNKDLFKRPPNMSNCDPYFKANRDRIHLEKAVPGIASGVLFQNLKPRFRDKRTIVSYDDGVNANEHNDFNNVFVDITTSFTILISIYFPSCTGILAGSNRSGDLADAQKSIPRGTLAAQLTTSFIYLSCIVLFGSTFNNLFIRDKFGESMGGQLAVTQIAWPHPFVILIGGLLSTLGASLQSLVGAPRILQGIAKDEVIPCFNRFAKLSARGEPETAIIFTLAISWLAVLIGNLDFIAPILTLSLVMCYFFINLACTLHSLLGSPNWRPRFKHYHWSISTLGCILCLFVMVVSSLAYFLVAIFLAGCIYKYIEFSGAEKEWGDGKQGLALSAARYNLLRLKTSEPHTKNWRPQVLLFCKLKPGAELEPPSARVSRRAGPHKALAQPLAITGGPLGAGQPSMGERPGTPSDFEHADSLRVAHPKLLTFASQLKAGKGLTLVSSVIQGDFKQMAPVANRARQSLQAAMQTERVKGFADVLISPDIADGLSYQVQAAGLGGLKHNTVIVGWPEHWRRSAVAVDGQQQQQQQLQQQQQQQRGSFKMHQVQQPPLAAAAAAAANGRANQARQAPIARNRAHQFIELMRNVQVSQNALLVMKGVDSWPESCDKLGGYIDIWWIVSDGGLLMLLPHLLKQHRTWKSCQLRIFTVAQPDDNSAEMRTALSKFLYHLRIEAQVDIVEMHNNEISDYAYERTLMMEQRTEIIKRLNLNRKQSLLLEQEVDGRVIRFRIRKPSTCDFEEAAAPLVGAAASNGATPISEQYPLVELPGGGGGGGGGGVQAGEAPQSAANEDPAKQAAPMNNLRPDEANLLRMHNALTLNEAILKQSKAAKLVITNLPGVPRVSTPEAENNYMEFIEILTDKLERVILVQNGGRELKATIRMRLSILENP